MYKFIETIVDKILIAYIVLVFLVRAFTSSSLSIVIIASVSFLVMVCMYVRHNKAWSKKAKNRAIINIIIVPALAAIDIYYLQTIDTI